MSTIERFHCIHVVITAFLSCSLSLSLSLSVSLSLLAQVFPELKFRYVEDQPDEFFIPYVWTLVFKSSSLYWDSTRIQFSATL